MEHQGPVQCVRGQAPIFTVVRVAAECDHLAGTKCSASDRRIDDHRRRVAHHDGEWCRHRGVRAIRDGQAHGVAPGLRVSVFWIRVGGCRAVAERPAEGDAAALGIRGTSARKAYDQGRLPGRDGCRGDGRRRLIGGADVADAPDHRPIIIRVMAEIGVVKSAIRPLCEPRRIAVVAIQSAVSRFEVHHGADVAVRVERQPTNPVLRVICKKVASKIGVWKLASPVGEAADHAGIPPGVRVGKNRAGETGDAAWAFAFRPAVVRAGNAEVDFLLGHRWIVAAYVADEQPSRQRINADPKWVSQTVGPDRVEVRAGAVVERVVDRDGTILVHTQDFPPVTRQPLRVVGHERFADGDVDPPIRPDGNSTSLMLV